MTIRIGFVSLGCPKNLVDTEVMMGSLARAGAELVQETSEADVVVVNTCGFIDAAREESVEAILEAAELKTTGRCRRLVVAGCLVQRAHEDLAREIPEIDAFVGLDDIPAILGLAAPELVEGTRQAPGRIDRAFSAVPPARAIARPAVAGGHPLLRVVGNPGAGPAPPAAPTLTRPGNGAGARPSSVRSAVSGILETDSRAMTTLTQIDESGPRPIGGRATWLYDHESPRRLAGPRHSAYLKIAEGCDNPCSFCAIPTFRGGFRSRRLGSILREAEDLAAQGVRELNLIAQDSTFYGHDLGLDDGPARLLRGLDGIAGLRWIRLFYVYPNRVTDSLLEALSACGKVVKYLDMPLQSASRSVLARMKRGGSAQAHHRLIARMRKRIPGLVLRSTYIVGFPGETDQEFEETLGFVREAEFDHVGVFAYSHEEGTSAFALEDSVPHRVKEERREILLAAQERIALSKNRARLGRRLEILCEGAHPESDDLLVGRHAGQAPEIDGTVILNEGGAATGEFVEAEIVAAHPFDLVARIVGPAALRGAGVPA